MQSNNPRHQQPLRGDLTDSRSSGSKQPSKIAARLNDRRSTRDPRST